MILTAHPANLHTLPLPLWVLLVLALAGIAWGLPTYLRESNRAARAHAARPSCPVHGDTVACPCQLSTVRFASCDLDTL